MTKEFLEVVKDSFFAYLNSGARSNQKLKSLHSKIGEDILFKINQLSQNKEDKYKIVSINENSSEEYLLHGRYIDKKIDIAILKNNNFIACISVKFFMSNIKQNKNNYFENMLGETANVRTQNYKYFQFILMPISVPYFDKNKNIKKWEHVNESDLGKYFIMSHDNEILFFHVPNKTFIGLLQFPEVQANNFEEYKQAFIQNQLFEIDFAKTLFKSEYGKQLIINDYEEFIQKVAYAALSD
ncbi:hypothetical protein FJO69_00420 [[Mycoplasma] falconis]|uniref:Restriction endonuclease n=1 Tax=[Mycoplasma] falconis TaxID=92403 RepID=A0A501XBX9_9BACT|nr:hypothetical protein [[Mycoplasma] falconis]TPE58060.1 hypothetical protein FJO69_00420 [[Mycoplasma] falconis]